MSDVKIIRDVLGAVAEHNLIAKVAEHALRQADVNDYPSKARGVKELQVNIASALHLTEQYQKGIEGKIDHALKMADKIKDDLTKLGVDFKPIARWNTMMTNALKAWRKTPCTMVYSKAPNTAAKDAFAKLVTNIGKQNLVKNMMLITVLRPVQEALQEATDALVDWRNKVHEYDFTSAYELAVNAEPQQNWNSSVEGYEEYAKAQRTFAADSSKVLQKVRDGIFKAFHDSEDPKDLLKAALKDAEELYKQHEEFGKKWGDFRAAYQSQMEGQKSLFA